MFFSQWGQLGYTPVVANFDGDGKADLGFYRDGLWGILKSKLGYSSGSAHESGEGLEVSGSRGRVFPTKSRFEQIVGIIIASLALLTALIPLIKAWLNIP